MGKPTKASKAEAASWSWTEVEKKLPTEVEYLTEAKQVSPATSFSFNVHGKNH
jgi:hypothetical protein